MKYLEATSPQSLEELEMFIEYLRRMKVIIGVSYEGSLVISVECDSLEVLEGVVRVDF